VDDRVGLACLDAPHALAAVGAIHTARGLGAGLLGRVSLFDLTEIAQSLVNRYHVRGHPGSALGLPLAGLELGPG
jgi:hypothetical protein